MKLKIRDLIEKRKDIVNISFIRRSVFRITEKYNEVPYTFEYQVYLDTDNTIEDIVFMDVETIVHDSYILFPSKYCELKKEAKSKIRKMKKYKTATTYLDASCERISNKKIDNMKAFYMSILNKIISKEQI